MKRPEPTRKARKFHVHLLAKETFQPVNAARWSEASKRSASPPTKYEDIHYECVKCNRASVFSAVDQKLAYEERQVYIWQRRTLCGECWNERRRVERAIRDCRIRWRDDKSTLRRDAGFLKHWLSLLELYPSFGARRHHAGIAMLLKLLGAAK